MSSASDCVCLALRYIGTPKECVIGLFLLQTNTDGCGPPKPGAGFHHPMATTGGHVS